MCDDISPVRPHTKTRSASICATSGSMEAAIYNLPSGSNTPENGTPGYKRRRPATRSQSARLTGARAAKKKVQQQQPNFHEVRTHCNSEPRLNETETPPQRRKLSQRHRPQQHTQRRSNAFLDVPSINMQHLQLSDPEDLDRLRTFSASKGGIINRGDSFRRRRSRSNSLAPVSPLNSYQKPVNKDVSNSSNHIHVESYKVQMLGSVGVGKAALVSQFKTSDCINAYDGPETDESEQQTVSIILNGVESELKFLTGKSDNKDDLEIADAFLVVFSVVDKTSFTNAEKILTDLQDMELTRTRPVILVANKIDLARSRAVSGQDGKCVACTFRAKFIEVSVGINHNCDELLAGTLTQIRLKKEHNLIQGTREHSASWYKSRGVVRASMKARQMITWILGKEDTKFKNCENLQVL